MYDDRDSRERDIRIAMKKDIDIWEYHSIGFHGIILEGPKEKIIKEIRENDGEEISSENWRLDLIRSKKKEKLVNLTPHDINILGEDGEILETLPFDELPARCRVERHLIGGIGNYPLYESVFGDVGNLFNPEENTLYVVSRIVAEAMKGERTDLIIPEDIVRDETGQILGCRGFAKV